MNIREQRGMAIAATKRITFNGGRWVVPSQSGEGYYSVRFRSESHGECTCPDFELRKEHCKHVFAAIFVMRREETSDGMTTVTETVAISEQRITYPQAWPAYNAAQTNEKEQFQSLLHDLCRTVPESRVKRAGRPTIPLSDAIFSVAFKVYSTVSGRRFMSDLRDAHRKGWIRQLPHYNSIFNYLEKPELTPILRELITQSSTPLQAIETDFAVDSSGFVTSRFTRWFDVKYGKEHVKHDWVKCHIMCGVKTNIVTAVEIGGRYAHDSNFLQPMLHTTRKNFAISEVSADKGYSSRANTDAIMQIGATPFIAFKGNTTAGVGGAYAQMFHYFMYRREEFLQRYHKRSNVESTFSMMKRKFGDSLRSKTDVAMANEALCKVLCHNLVVLIHEMHELGIDPAFTHSHLAPMPRVFQQ